MSKSSNGKLSISNRVPAKLVAEALNSKELLSVDFMNMAPLSTLISLSAVLKPRALVGFGNVNVFRPPSNSAIKRPDGGLVAGDTASQRKFKPDTDEGLVVIFPKRSIDTVTATPLNSNCKSSMPEVRLNNCPASRDVGAAKPKLAAATLFWPISSSPTTVIAAPEIDPPPNI